MWYLARRYRSVTFVVALLILCVSVIYAQTWTKPLARGVTYTQIVRQPDKPGNGAVPRIINVVKVDPKEPGVKVQVVLGGNDVVWGEDSTKGRETMGDIAKRLKAVAVVNGDFCDYTGDPLGLHISGGELISEPYPRRTMFGITADGKYLFDRLELDARITLPDGKWFPVRGINRPRAQNELVVYTSRWYSKTCANDRGSEVIVTTSDLPVRLGRVIKGRITALRPDLGDTTIPSDGIVLSGAGTGSDFIKEQLKDGMEITLEFNVKPWDPGRTEKVAPGWDKVVEAIGGVPRLIRDGKISLEYAEENVQPGFTETTHPRTAVGTTADGKLVLVTVDGRQSFATGMSLKDLAEFMLSQGCVNAVNLDGGGSTTLATWYGILNSPSDGSLRPLPNGIAVFADVDQSCIVQSASPTITISAPEAPVASGQSVQLTLLDATTGKPLSQELASRAIWATDKGIGFVDQSGRFFGYRAGDVEVIARLPEGEARATVRVVPAPPSKLTALFERENEATPENRSVLNVIVSDLNLNGYAGKQVRVKVEGGTADQALLTTDDKGRASTGITWESPRTGKVTVTSEGLPTVTLQSPKSARGS